MPSFEDTMENDRLFLTYSLALKLLTKSALILSERGADQKALDFITTGIELLNKQLREFADSKDLEDAIGKELDDLCKRLDIKRAS